MADYKVVDSAQLDADLKVVADAIRSKGGTSEQLSFPQGMKDAVEAIQSGGGSSEEFVGIKYSDFTGARGTPKIADASSLPVDGYTGQTFGGFPYLFFNGSTNPNGGWNVGLETIFINENTKRIQSNMFASCGNLKKIYGMENVTHIGVYAFRDCSSLTEFPYMPLLNSIDGNAFYNCKGLTKINFYKKPTSTFQSSAFNGCTNITDIYVPWSEGEVANSPWGATNATIYYNTTYDENHNPIV